MPLNPGASVGSKDMPTLAMTPVGVALGSSHGMAVVIGRKRERQRKSEEVAIIGRVSLWCREKSKAGCCFGQSSKLSG